MAVTRPAGMPVQIGCGAAATHQTLRQLEYAAAQGAHGAQVVLPYWMDMSEAEHIGFWRDVHACCPELPLIHYNIPRAKRFLIGPDYRRVLQVAPNLVGVKFTYAGSHFGALSEAIRLCPELSFFVAENLLASAMQLGARGSYSSLVCMNPAVMQQLYESAANRDWETALGLQRRVQQFLADLEQLAEEVGLGFADPVVDKGLAIASGSLVGHQRVRPPYLGWSDEQTARVAEWLRDRYPEFVTS